MLNFLSLSNLTVMTGYWTIRSQKGGLCNLRDASGLLRGTGYAWNVDLQEKCFIKMKKLEVHNVQEMLQFCNMFLCCLLADYACKCPFFYDYYDYYDNYYNDYYDFYLL